MKNDIIIFDTTLRDGEQSPGASMTINEKIEIALTLQELNVNVIEAGFAIASKEDFQAITEISKLVKNCTICSLARAVEKDIDAAYQSVKNAKSGRIHTFIATSDIHLQHKLHKTQEEVLELIQKSVKYARNLCDNIEWSAEDATRTESNYLIKCVEMAIKSGATTINLPDTVGFTTPLEYKKMFEEVIKNTNSNGIIFSTHCHNDLGMATANALCGIQGGAKQIECAINGIGERAGNTALEEIIMAIKTRNDLQFYTNINAKKIKEASKLVQKITGFTIQPNKSIVGKNAFLHESGIHQDGMLKNKNTYEIINPEDVGIVVNPITLGRLSGRAALKDKLKEFGCYPNEEELSKMFEIFKDIAGRKKFILDNDIIDIINENTGKMISQAIEFVGYKLIDNNEINHKTIAIKIKFNNQIIEAKEIGNGVIDAIFKAINKIIKIEPILDSFSIDAINSGSDATGMANVILSYNNQSFTASGCDNDITIAGAKAYINGVNKVLNNFIDFKL